MIDLPRASAPRIESGNVRVRGDRGRRPRPAFTLIELLVVIGVIVIVIGITIFAVGAVIRDARLSSGTNGVKGALGTARATAIDLNREVGAVFIINEDGRTAVILAQKTGASQNLPRGGGMRLQTRYDLVPNVEPVVLPAGIKVATPFYAVGDDFTWTSQPHLDEPSDIPTRMFGVFFLPDGSLASFGGVNFNDNSQTYTRWVDLDGDGQRNPPSDDFEYVSPGEEVFLNNAPFLAVFDDAAADELEGAYTHQGYIDEFADRIYFNRYTGVIMK